MHIILPSSQTLQNGTLRTDVTASASKDNISIESEKCCSSLLVNRRTVLASGVSLLGFPGESLAVVKQGLLAGRIPGLSEPDEQGSFTLEIWIVKIIMLILYCRLCCRL